MTDLGEFCVRVLKPGGHGIIFCSFSQFEKYRTILTSFTEKVLDYDNDPTGNTYTTTTIFNVEAAPLVFVRGDGHFNNTTRKAFNHTNMVEICVHFWRKGGDAQEIKKKLDYKTPNDFGEHSYHGLMLSQTCLFHLVQRSFMCQCKRRRIGTSTS